MLIKKVPWKNGFINIDFNVDRLKIIALNNMFEARPRTILVNKFSEYRESNVRKKYIYVYFNEELKPFNNGEDVVNPDRGFEFYEIKYTKTDYDEYYTIIPPSSFLYDYIVLTSSELGIVMSVKRRVFYEKIDNTLIIYTV